MNRTPDVNDVLSGRGKFASAWKGNIFFRELIQRYKLEYIIADDVKRKQEIADSIVSQIKELRPSGRFLIHDTKTNLWHDMEHENASKKIKQALREDAPRILESLTPDIKPKIPINDNELVSFMKMVRQYHFLSR